MVGISILLDEQTGMHESGRWHLADALPFIAYYVVFLDGVERDEVESSEDEDLLRFED